MVIDTDDICNKMKLRYVDFRDTKGYLESMLDPETRKGFLNPPHNLHEAKRYIASRIAEKNQNPPKAERFTIEEDGKYAGFVELHGLNIPKYEHRAYLGYCIHPDFRGKGLATEAVKKTVVYAFKTYNLKRLEAMCRSRNEGSIRVLRKAGFDLEGTLKNNSYQNGEYLDDMVWSITHSKPLYKTKD